MLVVVIIFTFGNVKDCLMKILRFLLQLIIALGRTGRNVIIFGVDMSLSTKIDSKKKFGKCPTQRLEFTLSAEKMY